MEDSDRARRARNVRAVLGFVQLFLGGLPILVMLLLNPSTCGAWFLAAWWVNTAMGSWTVCEWRVHRQLEKTKPKPEMKAPLLPLEVGPEVV